MSILAAFVVTQRVALILLACAMMVGLRRELWAVITCKPSWRAHLSSFVFVAMVAAGAIISSANMFPDANWYIPRNLRLVIVATGLSLFLVGTLTGLYRRALLSGPVRARAAFLTGLAFVAPGVGLMWLLTESGAHG